MITSERVAQILVDEGGYKSLPVPMKIGGVSFEFAHAFVGGDRANDLVVVIEVKGDADDAVIVRQVLALTRALDVLQSKRPVTAVLTAGQASSETLQSIGRVCRVLPVGAPIGPKADATVRDWLSVLLPFHQPAGVDELIDWEADVRALLGDPNVSTADGIFIAARQGEGDVSKVLASLIQKDARDGLAETEEDDA